jgi:hypothetical protein
MADKVTIRWSEVHWYEATVDRLDLAAVLAAHRQSGGMSETPADKLPDLTGDPWDHGEDFAEFIGELAGDNTRSTLREVDGIEVASVKPATGKGAR